MASNSIANNSDPEFPSWGSDLSRALFKHTVMTIPYGAQNEEMLCIDVKLCTVGVKDKNNNMAPSSSG